MLIGAASGLALVGAGLAGMRLTEGPDPFFGYSGQAAPDDPAQTPLDEPVLIEHPEADLLLFAEFSLTALVLSARSYRRDQLSAVSPLDLALAWGPASDPRSFRSVEYRQRGRWYLYRSRDPIPQEVHHSSSNMHMIPRDGAIERALRAVRRGDLIRLAGHLCDVRFPGMPEIRSSRSRTDRDGGACEIVLVGSVEVIA